MSENDPAQTVVRRRRRRPTHFAAVLVTLLVAGAVLVSILTGRVPGETGVFGRDHSGVANLDPDLLGALREAADAAADEGITLEVTSGWRSPEYQDQLLREAVSTYGSTAEAARWVATADTSAHVSGDAIDVGPAEAAQWLSERGADYGLCQVYANEPWHFELRRDAPADGCPATYADPTHDPRMWR